MRAMQERTCDLWVDQFSLPFKKISPGRWLYTQEKPGLLSNALKIDELVADGSLWNLTEIRIPMEQAKEQRQKVSKRTTWRWDNYSEFEVPAQCDFISYSDVQAPAVK